MNTNIELQKAAESYANGNKDSFNQIYELSYQYLHTCVIHVVKDEDIAMDMLQETYLEISKSISQLKNREGFLNWAATIANRKCYAYLKKQKDVVLYANPNEDETDDFFENIADDEEFIPETVLQDREKQRLIKEIIDDLTEVQRLCVIGFYYNEQKQEEIAEELGIPVNTVKSHLNRAKAKIKEAVVELDEKKGTRLYSMAPFMLLLFREEVQACVLKPMTTTLASAVGASVTASAQSESFTDIIAKIKTWWTKASMSTKVAIGATVGTIVIGGVAVILVICGIIGTLFIRGTVAEVDDNEIQSTITSESMEVASTSETVEAEKGDEWEYIEDFDLASQGDPVDEQTREQIKYMFGYTDEKIDKMTQEEADAMLDAYWDDGALEGFTGEVNSSEAEFWITFYEGGSAYENGYYSDATILSDLLNEAGVYEYYTIESVYLNGELVEESFDTVSIKSNDSIVLYVDSIY